MKRLGWVAVVGLVLVAGCALGVFIWDWFQQFQVEVEPQLETELVRVDSLPPDSYRTIGEGRINTVAVSPDGRTLATATTRGLVFYDTSNYQPTLSVPIMFGGEELAWSPDGQLLAVTGFDVGLALFDPSTGRQVEVFNQDGRIIRNLDWSPDSRYLAATALGMYREDVWVWDTQTGERIFELPDGTFLGNTYARDVSWSPAENRLAIAYSHMGLGQPIGGRDEIRIWQIGQQSELTSSWPLDITGVYQLAWVAGGQNLVILDGQVLRALDGQSGKIVAETQPAPGMPHFTLSPNGNTLAAGGDQDGTIDFYEALTLEHLGQLQTSLLSIDSLSWSADSAGVVASQEDRFQLWSWPDGRLLADGSTESPVSANVAWSPDSRLLAVGARHGVTHIYDGETGERILTVGEVRRGDAPEVAWSPDGSMLATTSVKQDDGRVYTTHVWSLDGELKASIPGELIAWADHSNKLMVAVRSQDNEYWAQVWEVAADGQTTKTSEFKKEGFDGVWSPDESLIASVDLQLDSPDDEIHAKIVIIEVENQSPVAELANTEMKYVRSLAWSPDGAWLAASYDYNCTLSNCARLEIWNTATWKSYKTFGRQDGSSWALSWSPDSRWLVATDAPTGSAVTLYPLDDGQMIRELDHHLGQSADVAWSPDGRKIASTNYDGQLTIWDAAALLP